MIREIVSRINGTLSQRRASARKKYRVPIKVRFAPEKNTANLTPSGEDLFLSGESIDVSSTGIAFVVSSIRIKEKYLVGQERILNLEIDLPGRKVRMQVLGRRYEKVGIHVSTEKYLIGAEITSISPEDQRSYEYFLRYGNKLKRNAEPSLELG